VAAGMLRAILQARAVDERRAALDGLQAMDLPRNAILLLERVENILLMILRGGRSWRWGRDRSNDRHYRRLEYVKLHAARWEGDLLEIPARVSVL
jgi:hypothetical protein